MEKADPASPDDAYLSEYKGTTLVGTTVEFQAQRQEVLLGLIDSIDKRYSDVTTDSSLLSCTTLADFRTWPPNIEEENSKGILY